MDATITHWQFLDDGELPFRTELSPERAVRWMDTTMQRGDRRGQGMTFTDREGNVRMLFVFTTQAGVVHDVIMS